MKKINFLLSVPLSLCLLMNSANGKEVFSDITFAIGTIISTQVKADDEKQAEFCRNLVNSETRRLENLLSTYIEDSDVVRLGKANGEWVEVSSETMEILEQSKQFAKLTLGTFDPTVGSLVKLWSVDQDSHRIPSQEEIQRALKHVDYNKIQTKQENGKHFARLGEHQEVTLGAIGKGYISDKVIQLLDQKGCTDTLLSFGGNIIGNGTNDKGKPWRIGLQMPGKERGDFFAVLPLDNSSIVTSGDYEKFFVQDGVKYHHLLNPVTGKPVRATLSSVTIMDNSSSKADALCTALFVMGWEHAIEFLKRNPELKAVLMNADKNTIAYTKNLESEIQTVYPDLKKIVIE